MADNAWWHDIGPVQIEHGTKVLGETFGSARVRLKVSTAVSKRDRFGDEPYDEIVTGTTVEVETNVTGPTLEQLAEMIPGAILTEGETSKQLQIKSAVGRSMRANAKELILKPIIDGAATTDEKLWLRIPKSHPKPDFDVVADSNGQRVYKCLWTGYADTTTGIIATMGKNAS